MIYLFLLDILIYNTTAYNIPLFLALLPSQKNFKVPLIIFLILSFFEYRYLLLLLIVYIIFIINKQLNKRIQNNNKTYMIKLSIDYFLYFLLVLIVKYTLFAI